MRARRSVMALGAGLVAVALLASGCSGSTSSGETTGPVTDDQIKEALNTPTTLTFWSWLPDIDKEVALFEAKYPQIKVDVQNVGQGSDEYTKVTNAISAGKGQPDVVQIEYPFIPQFDLTGALLDLAPYGAADLKSQFTESAWSQVAFGDRVLAVPQDAGPMGTLYREDILSKAGVEVPTTWADFATASATLKEKTGTYLTGLAPNDAGIFLGYLAQAGVKPFDYSGGTDVTVALDTPEAQKVAAYWNDLVQKDLVSTDPNFTNEWYQGLSNGKYATWLTAAWGPVFLQGQAGNTAGLWRAAKLPQWNAGDDVSANLGGSTNAVLKSSENPIAAYELAKFINTDLESVKMFNQVQSLYPPQTALLEDPTFTTEGSDFYGDQAVNGLFAEISPTVSADVVYPPFQQYVIASFNDTLGKAIADKTDLGEGLTAWQASIVKYAEQQGFTVTQ